MSRLKAILRNPAIVPKRLFVKLEFLLWQYRIYKSKNCSQIERMKGCHQGRRAFIIGNGPSLNAQDLEKLHQHGEITFASNKIFLIYPQTKWRPTYYCAQDIPFGQKFTREIWQQESHTQLLLPNIFHEQRLATKSSVRFFLNMCDPYPDLAPFGVSPSKFYFAGTVTFTLMQWAYYLGVKDLYLLGVDADYRDQSQYEIRNAMTVTDNVKSHFVDHYFAPGEQHHSFNINKQLRGYESALKFSKGSDMNVLNATRGGALEIFERIDFDSLF